MKRLLLSYIIGVLMCALVFDFVTKTGVTPLLSESYTSVFLFMSLLLAAMFLLRKHRAFILPTMGFFCLFGFVSASCALTALCRQSAVDWHYALYHNSSFQPMWANQFQQSLHALLSEGLSGNTIGPYDWLGFDSERFQRDVSVVGAMTIGWKDECLRSLRINYSAAGISHLLAISGTHVAIICTLSYCAFLRFVPQRQWQKLSALCNVVFLVVYALVTGMQPSVMRAVLMASVVMLCFNIFGNRPRSLSLLMFAAMVILLLNPILVFNVGFQLSFAAVIGIVVFVVPMMTVVNRRFPTFHKVGGSLLLRSEYSFLEALKSLFRNFFLGAISLLVMSLVCMVVCAPIVSYVFGELSLVSLLSNTCAALPSACVIIFTIVWLLLALLSLWLLHWCAPLALVVSVLARCVGYLLVISADILNGIAAWFGNLPFSVLYFRCSLSTVVSAYLFFIFLAVFISLSRKKNNNKHALMPWDF